MTPLYVTIDGVQKELTSLPGMVDGVQKDMTSLLATVDGVAREIFSSVKYTWEKYSCVDAFVEAGEEKEISFFMFSAPFVKIYDDPIPGSSTTSKQIVYVKKGNCFIYNDVTYLATSDPYSSGNYYYFPVVEVIEGYAKGDYIGTVESKDADIYPTDGLHTDGYWYVYVGSHEWERYSVIQNVEIVSGSVTENYLFKTETETKQALRCATESPSFVINSNSGQAILNANSSGVESIEFSYDDHSEIKVGQWLSMPNESYLSKMTVLVSSVSTKTTETVYPYWVEVTGSKSAQVVNTQGDYIDKVTSDDGGAYPENGVHTDGYWYVKI